ncbi:ImmA/IrrE family metallo-endopeptidase [Brachybacterium paraconglomeratum]|uniref:ImmA/IrrE family metallo-endopeptidase n=1 Tax=Brachybacterium paraconglomeratum TaxID=173362 RepID=UPI0037C5DE10
MRTTTDLVLHAEDMGATVHWALDLPERGRYYPGVDVIVIRHGMTERRTVSTLAHELAHLHYGDPLCTPAVNRRAWRWAARLLIPSDEYARAEQHHNTVGGMADHLGVTAEVIRGYQATLGA